MATAKKTPAEDTQMDFTGLNVYQKLQMARLRFLQAGAKKSGKNIKLEFTYFELADIVPTAETIFSEIGLLAVPSFGKEYATMKVYNCDDRDEDPVIFEAPFTQIAPIISNSGKAVTNEMQALGSSITYMRRYLWQLVLDIIEADSIDPALGGEDDTPAAPKPVKKAPVSTEQRKEIKKELTDTESPADDLQIAGLKGALKKLLEIDPEQESFVQEVALKTDSFTNVTRSACEALIQDVNEMIDAYNVEGE